MPVITFPEVQTISDVYSSGVWGTMSPEGDFTFSEQIFKNATSISIYAYVTINNQGDPAITPPAILHDGAIKIGSIPAGGSMGFLLLIGAGHVLSLIQSLQIDQATGDGTFTVAHVAIGPANSSAGVPTTS
jgi:hypothetical protein